MQTKTIKLTENCDMVYRTMDEVYYMIHQGDNEGVVFIIIDFIATYESNSIKFDYKPIVLSNEFNAGVDDIYAEITEIIKAKVVLYMDEM